MTVYIRLLSEPGTTALLLLDMDYVVHNGKRTTTSHSPPSHIPLIEHGPTLYMQPPPDPFRRVSLCNRLDVCVGHLEARPKLPSMATNCSIPEEAADLDSHCVEKSWSVETL
jgi:hypothetical protein